MVAATLWQKNGVPSEVVRTRRFESLDSKSAGVRKFVHLGMHKLAGVKLRPFQTRNFQTFNFSNFRTFELDWLLQTQTSNFSRGRVRSAFEV